MAVWTQAEINNLPDSAFLAISAGGTKDSSGKTTPRDLRHLPYRGPDGKVDLPHLKDALSRLDQTEGLSADQEAQIKAKAEKLLADADGTKLNNLPEELDAGIITPLELDASGELPTRFPIFVTGDWPNSIKGNFKVTLDSLKQMKDNFDRGIGFPTKDASTGLAANFGHDRSGPAGAWVKGIELEADEAANKGTLYATKVEYTDEGEKAIRSGRFKCISPEGAFGYKNGALSAVPSHLNMKERLSNVLTGFGFTNMPYLSEMAPVLCSAEADDDGPMIFVNDKNKENQMELDKLRVKDRKDLTVAELDHLADNVDKLDADERKKFKLEEPAAGDQLSAEDKSTLEAIKAGTKKVVDADAAQDTLSATDKDTLAAIQSGDKVVVDKDALEKLNKVDSLEKTAQEYRREKTAQFVQEQLERGSLKPDKRDETIEMLMAADDTTREQLEKVLSAAPSNENLAAEIGHDKDVKLDVNDELKEKTMALQKEAKESGQALTYGQALSRLMSQDADLKQRYEATLTTQTK